MKTTTINIEINTSGNVPTDEYTIMGNENSFVPVISSRTEYKDKSASPLSQVAVKTQPESVPTSVTVPVNFAELERRLIIAELNRRQSRGRR